MVTAIADLWAREQLPIRDGLYLADGRAYDFAVDAAAPSGGRVGAPGSIWVCGSNRRPMTSPTW